MSVILLDITASPGEKELEDWAERSRIAREYLRSKLVRASCKYCGNPMYQLSTLECCQDVCGQCCQETVCVDCPPEDDYEAFLLSDEFGD